MRPIQLDIRRSVCLLPLLIRFDLVLRVSLHGRGPVSLPTPRPAKATHDSYNLPGPVKRFVTPCPVILTLFV